MADETLSAATPAKIKARVILAIDKHSVDSIVTGKVAEAGIAAGWADGSDGAVAYAEKLAARAKRNAELDAD